MSRVKNWHRFATLAFLVTALAGCGKKDDAPKAEGDPKTAEAPKVEKKKDGDITMDDLRAAAKAAGGDLDKPVPPPKQTDSLANVKPDLVLNAEKWYADSKADYETLFKTHDNKIVELTGVVELVRRKELYLKGGEGILALISCPTVDPEPWKKALPGQTVTLRARFTVPFAWEITEVKGALPPTFTAEQLTRERLAGADAFDQKYKRKMLIVTGTVAKVGMLERDGQFVRVWFQGTEQTQMLCIFRGPKAVTNLLSPQQRDSLKMGQQVKVLGHYIDEQFDVDVVLDPAS